MKNKDLFADNIKNIAAVKHENDLKIKEYEDKLTTANESRTSTMFQVQKYSKHFFQFLTYLLISLSSIYS